jgi:pectate lyase
MPEAAHVNLSVYGIEGAKVATLLDGKKVAGYYKINFDAASYPSGVYFAVMESGSFRQIIKMILMK